MKNIDFNNTDHIDRIRKASKSPSGKLILQYLQSEIDKNFAYAIINTEADDEEVGKEFKRIKSIRDFFDKQINFLTSGDDAGETNK